MRIWLFLRSIPIRPKRILSLSLGEGDRQRSPSTGLFTMSRVLFSRHRHSSRYEYMSANRVAAGCRVVSCVMECCRTQEVVLRFGYMERSDVQIIAMIATQLLKNRTRMREMALKRVLSFPPRRVRSCRNLPMLAMLSLCRPGAVVHRDLTGVSGRSSLHVIRMLDRA